MRNVGAVILGAGGSSRFGQPKQLIEFRGKTLLRRTVDAAREAECLPIVVVIGSDQDKIDNALKQAQVAVVRNPNWQRGIGTSIRAGVQHLIDNAPQLDAITLLVCDQPFVDSALIKSLIMRREETQKAIVASSYADTLGVPALFDRSCFAELLALEDGSGAKKIILSNRERVAELSFSDGKIDIDNVEDYKKLLAEN
ncbi:MAG: molybdenum cofactor cytidylyltransferase [Verrucomicrobiota bacterium]|jgi:molybdenum cofactor cytidylyltransferase